MFIEAPWSSRLSTESLSTSLRDWLQYPDSLTQALKKLSSSYRIRLLSQDWNEITRTEKVFLKDDSKRYMVREIEQWCGDKMLVAARSIFPENSIDSPKHPLRYLGCTSLGDYLFQNASIAPKSFEFSLQYPQNFLYQRFIGCFEKPLEMLYARRRLFFMHKNPILIMEIFPPEMPNLP